MTIGNRTAKALLGILVATLLVVYPMVPAKAHTQAVASWPAAGQVVNVAPDRVTVAYTTELLPDARVEVVDADGTSLADGDPEVVGQIVTQALMPSAGPGVVRATFRVIGDDLHPIEGTLEFVVNPDGVETGNPAGPPPDLGLDDDESEAASASDDGNDDEDNATAPLLLTGLVGAAVLVVVLRLVARRRRG